MRFGASFSRNCSKSRLEKPPHLTAQAQRWAYVPPLRMWGAGRALPLCVQQREPGIQDVAKHFSKVKVILGYPVNGNWPFLVKARKYPDLLLEENTRLPRSAFKVGAWGEPLLSGKLGVLLPYG